jgi:galactose mutarotase-like enzyme
MGYSFFYFNISASMETTISNGMITARIAHKGAELTSLYNQATRLEYIWRADPKFWPKSSPILFPIVGALKAGTYTVNGRSFQLPRHGFARDRVFEIESSSAGKVTFLLKDDDATREVYPFAFQLRLVYEVNQFELSVSYRVTNPAGDLLYFSVGGHPAFSVPVVEGTRYEDYYLKFNSAEKAKRWPISKEGLIEEKPEPFFDGDRLPLTHELFYKDALVFKDLQSTQISIRSTKHTHGLDFNFHGFPFFGIWAFKDADFVCLEPWCGIADSVSHDGQLKNKEGIIELASGGDWSRTWSVDTY